ncbi:MAG: hypothetical protein IJS28_01350 [Synergistaceae bacterium]|nr:hypothetical protein [Synergistaceae bacterium]
MAVSSIFHHVILDTPEKIEAFANALEASLAHPYVRPEGSVARVATPEEVHKIWELREKNMRKKS